MKLNQMKTGINYLLLLLAFACSNLFGQPTGFYKTYATGQVELSLFELDTVHDGGYILIGSYENVNGGNAIVIKTDSLGNELWRKSNYYFTSLDSSNTYLSVKETADHGFILAGYIRILDSTSVFNSQYLLTKIDSIGNFVWQKIEGDSSQEQLNNVILESDTSFLVSGIKSNGLLNESILSSYNIMGDTLFTQEYTFSSFSPVFTSVNKFGDSLTLTITLYDNINFVFHSAIILTDLNGTYLDSAVFVNSSSTQPLCLRRNSDNSFLYLEKKYGINGLTILSNLNSDLSTASTVSLPFVLVGTIDSSENMYSANFSTQFYSSKLNQVLDTIWYNILNEEFLYPNYIISKDGCALICGRKDQDNTTIALGFLVRVCDSTIINGIAKVDEVKESLISTSIMGGNLQIALNEKIFKNSNISISIIDMNGRLLVEANNVTTEVIDLKSDLFQSAVYTVIVRSKNKIIARKKIIYNK